MKNMKKRISFLLALVMMFAMLAVPANAVTVDGDKVTDIKTAYGKDELSAGLTLRRGKKSYKKVILK